MMNHNFSQDERKTGTKIICVIRVCPCPIFKRDNDETKNVLDDLFL